MHSSVNTAVMQRKLAVTQIRHLDENIVQMHKSVKQEIHATTKLALLREKL